jgi:predicted acyltransferase
MPNKSRWISLDVFRGLTIALMIIVNSPGTNKTYSCLSHSIWNGTTLADLVFPFFIIMVGISSVISLNNLTSLQCSKALLFKKIVKRSLFLFAVGLFLNAFPNHFDLFTLRIPGVLQRIALCYFFSSLIFLTVSYRLQIFLIAFLLITYWIMLISYGSMSIENNLVGTWDTWLLGSEHLHKNFFDPEGIISTIPAFASVLMGNIAGYCLTSDNSKKYQLAWFFMVGLILSCLGLFWSLVFPFNKALWTSSYVLWTSGLAFLVFGVCIFLFDIKNNLRLSKPFALLGRHALLIYVLHVVGLKIQGIIHLPNSQGDLVNLRLYLTDLFFGSYSPENASLAYALFYTLCFFIVARMQQRT